MFYRSMNLSQMIDKKKKVVSIAGVDYKKTTMPNVVLNEVRLDHTVLDN